MIYSDPGEHPRESSLRHEAGKWLWALGRTAPVAGGCALARRMPTGRPVQYQHAVQGCYSSRRPATARAPGRQGDRGGSLIAPAHLRIKGAKCAGAPGPPRSIVAYACARAHIYPARPGRMPYALALASKTHNFAGLGGGAFRPQGSGAFHYLNQCLQYVYLEFKDVLQHTGPRAGQMHLGRRIRTASC